MFNQRTIGPVSLTWVLRICWIRRSLQIQEHSMLYKLSPIQKHQEQTWPCHKNGQGQPRVIIWKKPQGIGIQQLRRPPRGGGVSMLPENNAPISPAPWKYFPLLPKIILLVLPKSLKILYSCSLAPHKYSGTKMFLTFFICKHKLKTYSIR